MCVLKESKDCDNLDSEQYLVKEGIEGNVGAEGGQTVVSKESFVQRRFSPRIRDIPVSKRPYYGEDHKQSLDVSRDKVSVKKKKAEGIVDFEEGDSSLAAGKNATAMVKDTLRVFNMHYHKCVQVEENRCKIAKVNNLRTATSEINEGDSCDDNGKRHIKRPDLKAVSEMLKSKAVLHPERNFGHLQGINVGDCFSSRAEMMVVGLHGSPMSGIDYMGKAYGKMLRMPASTQSRENRVRENLEEKYKDYTFPLAVAVVLSGQYEDDIDDSEEVVYTGQGGNDLLGKKGQVKDQVMERGNLALKNNMEQSVPVRLIRGYRSTNNCKGKKVYTYDGLYKVVHYWDEKGISGFTVYKYRLTRLPAQPKLVTHQVHYARSPVSRLPPKSPRLVCEDISDAQEDICIPAINTHDPPVAPAGFTYIKSIQAAKDLETPPAAPGCNCKGSCTNPKTCSCAQSNGTDFPYMRKDGGRLMEPSDVVFECGPRCGCGPNCINRISQRKLKYRLEVYRTPNKGWAVRSRDFIPSGAPVCEYTGILRKNNELDNVSGNDYIFEIDCWHTMNGMEGRERRLRDVSVPSSSETETKDFKTESEPQFCIDAGSFGNVSRFINHSCEPNLFVQCVLSSHHDVRLARVVLFAADDIPPFQELAYDYGYALNSVTGPDGKIMESPCHCGAVECRKRLY